MSEEDFQHFNEIRRINIFQNYTPPFLVCKGNLYLFKFSHIIEISIAIIRNVSICPLFIEKLYPRKYNGGGDRVVITHTEKNYIYMKRDFYLYLTTLLYKYQQQLFYTNTNLKNNTKPFLTTKKMYSSA